MTISLSDLTARVQKRVEADAKLKKAKEDAKKAKSDHERRAANDEAAAIQAAMDWRPVALCLRKDHWQCQCGQEGEAPGGLFIFYEHTRMSHSHRLAPPRHQSHIDPNLPRRVLVDTRPVTACPNCAGKLGFLKPLDFKEKSA